MLTWRGGVNYQHTVDASSVIFVSVVSMRRLFLLDAIAAHQTLTGLDAVMEVLDYTKKPAHRELFQRYLMASSFATRGNELVIRKLLVCRFVQLYR